MSFLKRSLAIVHRLEDGFLVGALVLMLLMALLQIVMRNLFDSGFLWAESFLRILVLWVAILGAMVATREKNHISIDLLSRMLHPVWLFPVRLVTCFSATAVCVLAAWYSFEYIQYEYIDGTIAFGDVPVWVCQSIMPFGFAVMALRFLSHPFTSRH